MDLLDDFAIYFMNLFHAAFPSLKRLRNSCPPGCSEDHTFRWPCRMRISKLPGAKDYRLDVLPEGDQYQLMEIGPICGVRRAGGYGSVEKVCIFIKGHEGRHSWVADL